MTDLIFIAGFLHFGVLIASALVPQVLDWRRDLAQLSPLTRRLVWVHGAYVVFMIGAFGVLALLHADALASGTPLARSMCALIALFWGVRLALQYGVLDALPYVEGRALRAGYHGLTVVFAYFTVTFAKAAL